MKKNMQINSPKVAFISGAARRIGAEIARTLHAAGLSIVLHYHRSKNDAEALVASLNQIRENSAIAIGADLANTENANAVIQKAQQIWGRLDVLVNNASRFYKTPIGKVTDTEWEDIINGNLKPAFFLSQAAAPFLTNTQGVIINLADIHAERPMREYSVYCIAKAGIVMLTKTLARELGPAVRVNAIAPGTVALPEGENALTDVQKQKITDCTALKRFGDMSDVAKAVLFLVNDGGYITGQVLTVDGGRSLFIP